MSILLLVKLSFARLSPFACLGRAPSQRLQWSHGTAGKERRPEPCCDLKKPTCSRGAERTPTVPMSCITWSLQVDIKEARSAYAHACLAPQVAAPEWWAWHADGRPIGPVRLPQLLYLCRGVHHLTKSCHTMRFGSTAKVLLKCKPKYYRISECVMDLQARC